MNSNNGRRLHSSTLASLVAKTDFYPLRSVYRGIYWLGAKYLQNQLLQESGVLGIYLAGSFILGMEVHGVSDLDVLVVVDGQHRHNLPLVKRLRECFIRSSKCFPFIASPGFSLVNLRLDHLVVEERLTQIIFTREDGTVGEADFPYFLYRQRSGLTMPLFEKAGFSLAKIPPSSQDILNELTLQVARIIKKMLSGKDNLYFWKTRFRYLIHALRMTGTSVSEPTGNKELNSWIEELKQTNSYQLYKRLDLDDSSRSFEASWQLVSSVIKHLKIENEVTGIPDHTDTTAQPGSQTLSESIPIGTNIIEASGLSYAELNTQLHKIDCRGCTPLLCKFEDFAVLLGGGCFSAANRFSCQIIYGY
jgi:hypothetical protein